MELNPLKPKRNRSGDRKLKLPLKNEKEIVGVFSGLNVIVHDLSAMNYLYEEGCFGKGSFSKREPNYHSKKDDIPKIVFEQQLENQSSWGYTSEYVCRKKYLGSADGYELSVMSVEEFLESSLISDKFQKSWTEQSRSKTNLEREVSFLGFHLDEKSYDKKFKGLVDEILQGKQSRRPITSSFKAKNEVIILSPESDVSLPVVDNVDVRFQHEICLPEENLNLNWEESLYLKSVLGCLTIIDSDKKNLADSELWDIFKAADKNFLERYITYHYFRSKGWIVRSGIKFGGDFLLYKIGPSHYHSNYLVKVSTEVEISWRELIVNNRLAETFNKEVVFVRVSPYQVGSVGTPFPELLENYKVEDTVVSRWFPAKERKLKNT